MLKKKIRQFLPDKKKLAEYKSLQIFGRLLHDANLWHLNRTSVARAFSIGLFFAWVPVPFQMALSAGTAILFHANLPLSIALVWLTNPLTMPALFFFAYKLGSFILGVSPTGYKFSISPDWFMNFLSEKWQPFLLGCFILGVVSSILGHVLIRLIWRYFTIKSWRSRKHRFLPGRKSIHKKSPPSKKLVQNNAPQR